MKYIKTIIRSNEKTVVTIELADKCNNGHQDFSITSAVYIDGRWQSGGCNHEHILSVIPQYKIFVDLHLCDYNGIPMYAAANGFYHLARMSALDFIMYYGITKAHYHRLKDSENELEYSILLDELRILARWKIKASKGIKFLEILTHEKFVNTSTRSNYVYPEAAEVSKFREMKKAGYYSLKNKAERKRLEVIKIKAKAKLELNDKYKKDIALVTLEFKISLQVLSSLGAGVDNYIYHPNINELTFNWTNSRETITEKQIARFKRAWNRNNKARFTITTKGKGV